MIPQPSTVIHCSDITSCFQSIYNFLFAILIALAFLNFLYGAFLYLLSAGGVYPKDEGKKKMVNSIISVILALSIPIILYMIDPNIFKAKLQVPEVKVESPTNFSPDTSTLEDTEANMISSNFKENQDIVKIPENLTGIEVQASDKRTNNQLLPYLKRAGQIAAQKKCTLVVFSAYRSEKRQQDLWNKALAKYGSPEEARKFVAPPGHSPHNFGLALDIHIRGNNCKNKLKDIMCQAGFVNYAREGWHFEMFTNRWRNAGGQIIGNQATVRQCQHS